MPHIKWGIEDVDFAPKVQTFSNFGHFPAGTSKSYSLPQAVCFVRHPDPWVSNTTALVRSVYISLQGSEMYEIFKDFPYWLSGRATRQFKELSEATDEGAEALNISIRRSLLHYHPIFASGWKKNRIKAVFCCQVVNASMWVFCEPVEHFWLLDDGWRLR